MGVALQVHQDQVSKRRGEYGNVRARAQSLHQVPIAG